VVHDEHDEYELIDLQSCNAMDRYQLALCSLTLCIRMYINICHIIYMQVRMFPNLYAAKAIEVVLVMGEVLYLPGG